MAVRFQGYRGDGSGARWPSRALPCGPRAPRKQRRGSRRKKGGHRTSGASRGKCCRGRVAWPGKGAPTPTTRGSGREAKPVILCRQRPLCGRNRHASDGGLIIRHERGRAVLAIYPDAGTAAPANVPNGFPVAGVFAQEIGRARAGHREPTAPSCGARRRGLGGQCQGRAALHYNRAVRVDDDVVQLAAAVAAARVPASCAFVTVAARAICLFPLITRILSDCDGRSKLRSQRASPRSASSAIRIPDR